MMHLVLILSIAFTWLAFDWAGQVKSRVFDGLREKAKVIDLIIGAPSSKLDLFMCCAIFEKGASPLIARDKIIKALNDPAVKFHIINSAPIGLGDYYKGQKIIWTDVNFPSLYGAKIEKGRIFEAEMEIIIGSEIAQLMNLKIGDQIFSSHGASGHDHEENYQIVGILSKTTSPIDTMILAHIDSIEHVHKEQSHDTLVNEQNSRNFDTINAFAIKLKNPNSVPYLIKVLDAKYQIMAISPRLEIAQMGALIRPFETGARALLYGFVFIIALLGGCLIFVIVSGRSQEWPQFYLMGVSKKSFVFMVFAELALSMICGLVLVLFLSIFAQTIFSDIEALGQNLAIKIEFKRTIIEFFILNLYALLICTLTFSFQTRKWVFE